SKHDILISVANLGSDDQERARSGRLCCGPPRLREQAIRAGFGELPIRAPHVLEARALPPVHSDPFDRIVLAQARVEQLTLLARRREGPAVRRSGSIVVSHTFSALLALSSVRS